MSRSISFNDLDDVDRQLVSAALNTSMNAYAPYSGFAVGAAVRTKSGKIFVGANLENAAYGVGMCAEVGAITAANSAGEYMIEAVAVVGFSFAGATDAAQVVTPCGRCRQLIFEASQISGTDVKVFSCSGDLAKVHESTISELLPDAFGPQNLGVAGVWPDMRVELTRRAKALQHERPGREVSTVRRIKP